MKNLKLLFTLILLTLTGIVSAQTQGFNADSVFLGRTVTSAIVLHGNRIWLPDIPTFGSASSKFIGFNGTKLITRTAAQVRSDIGAGTGDGTVTSVSVTTANGVSGSVATATTTPAITLTLGAITPSSINSVVLSGSSTPTLAVTGTSSISGANTGDQTTISGNAGTATALQNARTIGTITGDATSAGSSFNGTANNTNALTLATVNSTTGTFGDATHTPIFVVNGKGLITAALDILTTPAVGSITGLGTGVATALGINVGSAGAPVVFNGAGGTPSSLTGTNITGTASGLSIGGSAAILTTTHTIFGQNFNGSANVSGALSGATTGTFSSFLNIGSANFDDGIRMADASGNFDRVLIRSATSNDVYIGDIDNNSGSLIIRASGADKVTVSNTALTSTVALTGTSATFSSSNSSASGDLAGVSETLTQTAATTGSIYATVSNFTATHTSGTVNTGVSNRGVYTQTGSGGTITTGASFRSEAFLTNGTTTNYIGFYAAPPNVSGGGSIGTKYSFFGDAGAGKAYITDGIQVAGTIRLKNYTVATLPAGSEGDTAYVSDGLTPSFGVIIVGGGSTKIPVFYNGANWVAF